MNLEQTLLCCTCKLVKPYSDFAKYSRSTRGYSYTCKLCHKKYIQQHYMEHRALYIQRAIKRNKSVSYFHQKKWKRNNIGIVNSHTAKRHAAKMQALPKWLSKQQMDEIKALYIKANKLTKETGILWTVDHIIPLQGVGVRGLHVPWNLQLLEGSKNYSKHNKLMIKPEIARYVSSIK